MHKISSSRHQKSGSKRNSSGAPPFPVPMPYHQPPVPPVFHAMVPPPHIAVPGYAFPPGPGPFPSVENPLVKPASQAPRPAFVPTAHAVDAKTVQPSVQRDPNAYSNISSGRLPMQEQVDHLNNTWHHQRAFPPRTNISMQQGMGTRTFIRPPFYGPPPGYMVAPSFPGKYSFMILWLYICRTLCGNLSLIWVTSHYFLFILEFLHWLVLYLNYSVSAQDLHLYGMSPWHPRALLGDHILVILFHILSIQDLSLCLQKLYL